MASKRHHRRSSVRGSTCQNRLLFGHITRPPHHPSAVLLRLRWAGRLAIATRARTGMWAAMLCRPSYLTSTPPVRPLVGTDRMSTPCRGPGTAAIMAPMCCTTCQDHSPTMDRPAGSVLTRGCDQARHATRQDTRRLGYGTGRDAGAHGCPDSSIPRLANRLVLSAGTSQRGYGVLDRLHLPPLALRACPSSITARVASPAPSCPSTTADSYHGRDSRVLLVDDDGSDRATGSHTTAPGR